MEKTSKPMTLKEVAAYLGLSYKYALDTYLTWKSKYGITAYKPGRKVLFDPNEVQRAFKQTAIN